MNTEKNIATGEVAAEQIESWKKKYSEIFIYEVDGRICYMRRPDRQVISVASVAGQSDPFKFAEVILVNCWLGGDEAIRAEDKYFMGLANKISELVEVKMGEIKKL